uniref:Uncharacterized protein n=1 Tax=Knipowitschia caucasica TaxID=637954 RepID=A0AAV2JZW9_KNICA
MAQLSRCIFVWDQSDLQRLIEAKRAELEACHLHPSDDDVRKSITKKAMQLNCKRAVRPAAEMEVMLGQLLAAYDGGRGCNSLGVPLINSARMKEIWKAQRRHIPCLQDPPGFQLYTQTGTVTKAGHVLPTYCCARGSTSLESFHLHMNRFIPVSTTVTSSLSATSSLMHPSASSMPSASLTTLSSSQDPSLADQTPSLGSTICDQESVGPDNIQGFKQVQDLVDHLFSLRDHGLALSNEEAFKIVTLWSHLQECFAGGKSPAQWPDCNRVCEGLFVRLCCEYKGARRMSEAGALELCD